MRFIYMPRKAKKSKDFGEITLAIALLGGIIVVLLKIIDFSNNQSLEIDASLKPLVYGLMGFLSIELLIIFLFFSTYSGLGSMSGDVVKQNNRTTSVPIQV